MSPTCSYAVTGMACGQCVNAVTAEPTQFGGGTEVDVALDPTGKAMLVNYVFAAAPTGELAVGGGTSSPWSVTA